MKSRSLTRLNLECLESRVVPAAVYDSLTSRVADHFDTSTGRNGFAVLDLGGDGLQSLNGNQVFGTSSTIKLGVLYALLRRVDSDPNVSLSTTLNVGVKFGTNQGDT